MSYWLFKSEPEEFSFDDLKKRPKQREPWDGVRNYQARNFMRDDMKVGDQAFFYHSNCEVPGIVGIMQIVSKPYPDPTAFDPQDKHYDPKSDPEAPRWILVDVGQPKDIKRALSLTELKEHAEALEGFPLVRRGNRLSVMPVAEEHWNYICDLMES